MSQFPPTSRSAEETTEPAEPPALAQPSLSDIAGGHEEEAVQTQVQAEEVPEEGGEEETEEVFNAQGQEDGGAMENSPVIVEEDMTTQGDVRPRPRLTTSNSGADIMLGLETDDGKTAEVEIDSLETDELQPEEIPKGRVRKASIVEKLSKSKESEMIALSIMENAGQRQRDFEKLINEHQELVQEISRTPSAENIVQSEAGRDP